MKRRFIIPPLRASITLFSLVQLGCAHIIYPGPDQYAHAISVSKIGFLIYDDAWLYPRLKLSPRQVDGRPVGGYPRLFKPGIHSAGGMIRVGSKSRLRRNCDSYSPSANCDTSYVTYYKEGICEVDFFAAPGKAYEVAVDGDYNSAQGSLTVFELPEARMIAKRECLLPGRGRSEYPSPTF